MRIQFQAALLLGGAVLASVPAHAALVISDAATSNVSCAAGTCTATAADAVLNAKDLKKLLKAGDLQLVAGADAMDIVVDTPFAWARHALTFDAFRSLEFRQEMTSQGRDHVTVLLNHGGSGGELFFTGAGRLTFWDKKSALTIDGHAYALVNDVEGLRNANPAGFIALARDYDAAPDGVYRHNPMRSDFSGAFEGLGHTISNLSMIHGTEDHNAVYGGLFGVLTPASTVRNLNLQNTAIKGQFMSFVGALAGYGQGTVAHVSASVIVTGGKEGAAGGLITRVSGTVRDCTVTGTVIAPNRGAAGGLAWSVDASGTILRSHAQVQVAGSTAGGLVAFSNGTISLSSANSTVSATGVDPLSWPFAAGLVAESYGTVDRSFSTGPADAGSGFHLDHRAKKAEAGGLVGRNHGLINNSYTLGPVRVGKIGQDGGFENSNDGTVSNSYATGAVTRTKGPGGGFSFYDSGSFTNDYWDSGTAGTPQGCVRRGECIGVTGLTDAQLKSGLPAGFDPAVWAQSASINNGYPYLIANPPPQ